MTVSDQHLDHLSKLLSEGVSLAQGDTISEKTLKMFFKTIAEDRVRIRRADWRGLRMDAMLWHLPDLRSAGRAALSEHVRNQWHNHKHTIMPADAPEANQVEARNSHPIPTVDPIVAEQPPHSAPREKTSATLEKHPAFALNNMQRRDWFDRFTDWVAAVVTLWK